MVIIDEADALVPPAQNALLKTLEEPPPSSVFILVTVASGRAAADGAVALPAAAVPAAAAQDDLAAALVARGLSEARGARGRGDGRRQPRPALEASAGDAGRGARDRPSGC